MKGGQKLRSILTKIEHRVDYAIYNSRKKLNLIGELAIYPYIGYTNNKEVYVKGRVLEKRNMRNFHPTSHFENFKLFYRRYFTNEIPDEEVKGVLNGKEVFTKTDNEGFFELKFEIEDSNSCGEVKELEIELTNPIKKHCKPVKARAEAITVNNQAEFGVISDIDDTILNSHAGSLWKSFKVLILNTARSRSPFRGVPEFYQLLQKGKSGKCQNPLFYVSGSSWNLYDLILKFCEENNIPKGPFFLRDRGLTKNYFFSPGHFEYKPQNIESIMNFYPDLSFLLIGDSGQKDAEIYREIAKRNPKRVKGIIIRNVSKPKRSKEVQKISQEVKEVGVPMCLTKNVDDAIKFTKSIGLI